MTIGHRCGQRLVKIADDGAGFDGEVDGAGQGLKNIKARTESIEGGFSLSSKPGSGTAIEVTLRA